MGNHDPWLFQIVEGKKNGAGPALPLCWVLLCIILVSVAGFERNCPNTRSKRAARVFHGLVVVIFAPGVGFDVSN